jgi:hypothetical protein
MAGMREVIFSDVTVIARRGDGVWDGTGTGRGDSSFYKPEIKLLYPS